MSTELPLERSLWLYVVGEAVEMLLRFERILDRQASCAPREYKIVISLFRETLNEIKEGLADNKTLIGNVLFGKDPQEVEILALFGLLQNLIKSLYGIHERLVFLPRETVELEVFSTLEDLFSEEWKSAESSVILTSIYNAYEYCYLDVARNVEAVQEKLPDLSKLQLLVPATTSILELPIIDRDNPLSWPFLAHEFGHSLDRKYGITPRLVKYLTELKLTSQQTIVVSNWISEIFADLVAGRVLGPAAMLPLFSMEIILSPIIEASTLSSTHPPTPFRLSLLKKYLHETDLSFTPYDSLVNIYESVQSHKLQIQGKKEKSSQEASDNLLKYIFNQLERPLEEEIRKLKVHEFTNAALVQSAVLKNRLKDGIPIPSQRAVSDAELRGLIDKLMAESNRSPAQASELFGNFSDQPTSCAEILSAGWLYKLETYPEKLKQVFFESQLTFDNYSEYLTRLDDLILKSLRMSSVHTTLLSTGKGL
jgi:hypothetical protein